MKTENPQRTNLSDYCLMDHLDPIVRPSYGRAWPVWKVLLTVDRLMHFTGPRSWIWKLMGIGRSSKNPNVCNA